MLFKNFEQIMLSFTPAVLADVVNDEYFIIQESPLQRVHYERRKCTTNHDGELGLTVYVEYRSWRDKGDVECGGKYVFVSFQQEINRMSQHFSDPQLTDFVEYAEALRQKEKEEEIQSIYL